MKTAKELRAAAQAFLAEIEALGADYVLTDEDRSTITDFQARIEQAEQDEAALAVIRAADPTDGREVRVIDVTGRVDAGLNRDERSTAIQGIDQRANVEAFVQRGAINGDSFEARAALTTTSVFGEAGDASRGEYHGALPAENPTLTFISIVPKRETTLGHVDWFEEVLKPNAAAARAEGQALPEGAFELKPKTTALTNVGEHITVTEQSLANVPELNSLVDNRLRSDVAEAINKQALKGTGVSPNIVGLLNSGIETMDAEDGIDGEGMWISVRKGITLSDEAKIPSDSVFLHPTDWELIELFLIRSRIYAPGTIPSIHGKTVVLDTEITPGTSVVGPFRNARALEVLTRGGMKVIVAREHASNAVEGKVTLVGKQEVGLKVIRPASFVQVNFGAEA